MLRCVPSWIIPFDRNVFQSVSSVLDAAACVYVCMLVLLKGTRFNAHMWNNPCEMRAATKQPHVNVKDTCVKIARCHLVCIVIWTWRERGKRERERDRMSERERGNGEKVEREKIKGVGERGRDIGRGRANANTLSIWLRAKASLYQLHKRKDNYQHGN